MVSALDSGSNGLGLSPSRGTALCSWAIHFTLTVPLSTQVYKCYKCYDGPLGSYAHIAIYFFLGL